jgi:hypothetical protein
LREVVVDRNDLLFDIETESDKGVLLAYARLATEAFLAGLESVHILL